MQATGETWIILGASRGLGLKFAEKAIAEGACSKLILSSRKIDQVRFESSTIEIENLPFDFTLESQWEIIWQKIFSINADRIFNFSGGGPFGDYGSKAWKDHQWAFRLNFLFPAFIMHQLLSRKNHQDKFRQILFIGSAIAESAVDPGAASYSASKHALRGLIQNLQAEILVSRKNLDLRLYSPSYMDTELLPSDAWPRHQEGLVLSTERVVIDLWQWLRSPHDANTQRIFTDRSLLK